MVINRGHGPQDTDGYFTILAVAMTSSPIAGYRVGPGEVGGLLQTSGNSHGRRRSPDALRTESITAFVVLNPA